MEQVDNALLEFRCTKDEDIQNFLHNKAREYEERGWCSTYVLANEELLSQDHKLSVDGYFTLSNKVIRLSDSISKSKKKRLFGGLKRNEKYIHFILIGQLGKFSDDNYNILR